MKWGHVEDRLRAANPRTWRDTVAEMILATPDVIVIVGAGVALLLSFGIAVWVQRTRERKP